MNEMEYVGQAADTSRLPSSAVWGKVPIGELRDKRIYDGCLVQEDFSPFGLNAAVGSNVGHYTGLGGQYISYESTSSSLTLDNTSKYGVITFSVDATTHHSVCLENNNGVGGMVMGTTGTGPIVTWETRFQLGQIGNTFDFFAGLCEKGGAANNFLFSTSDALNQKSLIGGWILAAAGNTLVCGVQTNGAAPLAATYDSGAAPVLVASTWYKFGFRFNPNSTKPMRWFLNGQPIAYLTTTAATFPTAVLLNELLVLQTTGSNAATCLFDWKQLAAQELT